MFRRSGDEFKNLVVDLGFSGLMFKIYIDSNFDNSDNNFNSEMHSHCFYEFQFFEKGSGFVFVNDDKISVDPGSYMIIRPGNLHMQKDLPQSPIQKHCFKFEIDIDNPGNKKIDANTRAERNMIMKSLRSRNYFYSNDTQNIYRYINQIHIELENKPLCYQTSVNSCFLKILVSIFRDMNPVFIWIPPLKNEAGSDERLAQIESYFDNCINNYDAAPAELSNMLHVSCSQMNRILKEKYNRSFKQKMTEMRMEYAKDLLKNSELSLKMIAEKTLYSCECNFSAAFKKNSGFSPGKYRLLCKQ
jgi:AraC-like DNA-binding protein